MFRILWFLFIILLNNVVVDSKGYVAYCPCMGRFGNQADHFLGALAFSKGLNRTLILPPWVEYRYGEPRSMQVPFDTYFSVDSVRQYHDAITMEEFMNTLASTIWPNDERTAFCYTQRAGEEENSCNAKSGNPFGPFWNTFGIEFSGSQFYGPLNYDAHNQEMMNKWKQKYSPDKWPVLAFTGAPASFPVQDGNQILQKYVTWNENFTNKTMSFIARNMPNGGFLGIHLRNGQDWKRACEHVKDSPMLFAAPQCVGYKNERGPLIASMCLPQKKDIIKQVKRALKKVNDIKYLYVASDYEHMVEYFKNELQSAPVTVVKNSQSDPHLDLAILGQANYFIGNCVSSYTAFVKRERDVRGLPSEFWSFPYRKKSRQHEDL